MTDNNQHLLFPAHMKGDDCGVDVGPDVCIIPMLNETKVARIRKLTQLCKDEELTEVRFYSKEVWLNFAAEEVRTDVDELVVTSTGFWFTCCLKNTDIAYETPALTIEDVLNAYGSASNDALIPLGLGSNGAMYTLLGEDTEEQSSTLSIIFGGYFADNSPEL